MTTSSRTTAALEVLRTAHHIVSQQEKPLRIPDEVACLLPDGGILVPEILNFIFPPIAPALPGNGCEINAHFSNHAPYDLGPDLLAHPVPDETLRSSLMEHWRQHHLGGAQSICYTPTGGTLCYYPFWVLTWWDLVASGVKKQRRWLDAREWLHQAMSSATHPAALAVFTQVQQYISQLEWDTSIPFEKDFSTSDLSFYLSDNWLASRHMDWMIEAVQSRLESLDEYRQPHGARSPAIIYASGILTGMEHRFESVPLAITPEEVSRFLRPLQVKIAEGESPRVYAVFMDAYDALNQSLLTHELDEAQFMEPQSSIIELNLMTLVQIRERHGNPRALRTSKNFAKLQAENKASNWNRSARSIVSILLQLPVENRSSKSKEAGASVGSSSRLPANLDYISLARSFAQTLQNHEISNSKISDRLKRWMSSGDGDMDSRFRGNTANAKQAAETRANTYVQNRRNYLRRNGIIKAMEDLATARITTMKPIEPGNFVWAIAGNEVKLCKVIAIYVKEGGYNSMHSWVPKTAHIGHISYAALQIYQKIPQTGPRVKFRATHYGKALEISYYHLAPANDLLMILPDPTIATSTDGQIVELTEHSRINELTDLAQMLPRIQTAMKAIPRAGAKVQAID